MKKAILKIIIDAFWSWLRGKLFTLVKSPADLQKERDDKQWRELEDEKNEITDRCMPIARAAGDAALYNNLYNRLRQIDREQNQLRPRGR